MPNICVKTKIIICNNDSQISLSIYMYGITASNPGFREFVGVSSGQSLDEMILLITVD